MSVKPGIVCKLEKGKLIDTQKGFVDTFNWLVDCMANLKGESPINVIGVGAGSPVVKYNPKNETTDDEGNTTAEVDPDTPTTTSPVTNLDEEEETGTDEQSIHNLIYRPATHQLVAIRADGTEFVVFTATPVSEA